MGWEGDKCGNGERNTDGSWSALLTLKANWFDTLTVKQWEIMINNDVLLFSPPNEETSYQKHLPEGAGVLLYMGYIGMCHCEGYGFQAVLLIFQETDQLVEDFRVF